MDEATKARVAADVAKRGGQGGVSLDDYLLDVLNRVVELDLPETLATDALEVRDRLDAALILAERSPRLI